MSRPTAAALLLAGTMLLGQPARAGERAPSPRSTDATITNRLIHSSDPYLLEHAHNPVDWYPWGQEAFAKARAENKPIFLSIGYSTCYWCHVAETTIYSNPAIAALMNKWFVNIKVDREQRPDVDRFYIIATEMLTQHGAWPNNLFLTPALKPFYAGSYFPPDDQPGGSPGFPTVLAAIHDLWEHHRADQVDPAANELFEALKRVQHGQADGAAVVFDPEAWRKRATNALLGVVDPENGGLGRSGPKFPQAPALALLLAEAGHDSAARVALAGALDAIASGGIHDQIGGGIHRYATEPTWSIPHFEKMLSDNAQLLAIYAGSYALTKRPLDRAMAQDIVGYLEREMMAPFGGFYTAQDAAVNGVEGGSYLWSRAQIKSVLGAQEAERFLVAYDLAALPDHPFPRERNAALGTPGVLRLRVPLADTVKRTGARGAVPMLDAFAVDRAKLLVARRERVQPTRDDKVLTNLNGLAIAAFARAGVALDRTDLLEIASKAANRVWSKAYDAKGDTLMHQIFENNAGTPGYLEDYAMLGDGFLTLAEATHDGHWRERAVPLADIILARFLRPDGSLAANGDALPIALEDGEDADVPSGTSAALALLARLGATPGGARFEAAAAKIATHLAARIAKTPQAWPSALVALTEHPLSAVALKAARQSMPAPASERPTGVSTADHVHASGKVEGDTVVVMLRVDHGYHINAHQPSLDYLVPTTLTFAPYKPLSVVYPQGTRFKPSFAPDSLAVYEGSVAVVAHFPKDLLAGAKPFTSSVTAQACDAHTCLPPATLPVKVPSP